MAVRREVVSLSQLLQRNTNGSRNQQQQSLSEMSASETADSSSNRFGSRRPLTVGYSSQGDPRSQQDGFHGLQPQPQPARGRPPLDRTPASQGFQSLLQSQPSQTETYAAPRSWSQSQDVYPPTPNNLQVHSQPRPLLQQHNKFAKILVESSAKRAKERTRGGDEELLGKLLEPVKEALGDITYLIARQDKTRDTEFTQLGGDMKALRKEMERFRDQTKNTKRNCDDCHDKISREATAAREAFEAMGSRMGAMEKNVDAFIANMTVFVREELFELHVQRESKAPRSSSGSPFSPDNSQRTLTKKRVDDRLSTTQRYSPLSCTGSSPRQSSQRTNSHRQENRLVERPSANPANNGNRRSKRLQSRRAKEKANDDVAGDDEDKFGLKLALERVEEARAKRRRHL